MRTPAALLAALMLAGCAAPAPDGDATTPTPCTHPWPCGDGSEWPPDLVGPFERASVERFTLESHDGVVLNGWVALPATPVGVKLPAVLHSTPYVGQDSDSPEFNGFWGRVSAGVPFSRFVEEGYALVVAQVRGTGASGGCYEALGPNEQLDQRLLVEWVADQSWSNGRVGMAGLSYHGTTPIEAAIQAPHALKTIVVAGIITDLYTGFYTPQGAARALGAEQPTIADVTGPPSGDAAEDETDNWLGVARERACPGLVAALAESSRGALVDDRDDAFWEPRRLLAGVPNISAAVLMSHGFHDSRLHGFQDDPFWAALPETTPRAFLMGQWSHEWPTSNTFRADWTRPEWEDRQMRWLDHWLKGIGPAPVELGTVEFQDDAGTWRNATAWPPAKTQTRALYLADEALAHTPALQGRSFLAAHDPVASAAADDTVGHRHGESPGPLCAVVPGAPPRYAGFASAPLDADLALAGRAFAALTLRSDAPGGNVYAALLDLAPDFACDARGVPTGARWISGGAADLRYHTGGYEAIPFPVGEATFVRIDLLDLAAFVPAGHRLALFLSAGDATWARHADETGLVGDRRVSDRADGLLDQPTIMIEPASHLVFPVLEGDIGIAPPLAKYPPRPFIVE